MEKEKKEEKKGGEVPFNRLRAPGILFIDDNTVFRGKRRKGEKVLRLPGPAFSTKTSFPPGEEEGKKEKRGKKGARRVLLVGTFFVAGAEAEKKGNALRQRALRCCGPVIHGEEKREEKKKGKEKKKVSGR